MKLVRTFHPVGHGAFYTERFYNALEQPVFTAVFDCGCFEAGKPGTNPKFFKNQIEKIIKDFFNENDVIDALFISHFHTDHINGVDWLLKNCQVKRIFIPVLTPRVILEAYIFNYIQTGDLNNPGNKFIEGAYNGKISNITQIRSTKKSLEEDQFKKVNIARIYDKYLPSQIKLCCNSLSWQYIPYNLLAGQHSFLLYKTSPLKSYIKKGKIDFDSLRNYLQSQGVDACKKIYENHIRGKNKAKIEHNSYSMTTLSFSPQTLGSIQILWNGVNPGTKLGLLNCLYMGDFEANDTYPRKNANLSHLKSFYKSFWKYIGILQVPHHGSEHNYHNDLYDYQRHCIISHGMTDKYNHPDALVINGINRNQCLPLQVTEDPASEQIYTYTI